MITWHWRDASLADHGFTAVEVNRQPGFLRRPSPPALEKAIGIVIVDAARANDGTVKICTRYVTCSRDCEPARYNSPAGDNIVSDEQRKVRENKERNTTTNQVKRVCICCSVGTVNMAEWSYNFVDWTLRDIDSRAKSKLKPAATRRLSPRWNFICCSRCRSRGVHGRLQSRINSK